MGSLFSYTQNFLSSVTTRTVTVVMTAMMVFVLRGRSCCARHACALAFDNRRSC